MTQPHEGPLRSELDTIVLMIDVIGDRLNVVDARLAVIHLVLRRLMQSFEQEEATAFCELLLGDVEEMASQSEAFAALMNNEFFTSTLNGFRQALGSPVPPPAD